MRAFDVKWLTAESIDYKYEHPEWGMVPSTCASWDPASAEVFAELADQLGPYAEPEPKAIPESDRLAAMPPVSHAQMIGALIGASIITEAEGIAWITGTLPDAVEAMITALPAEQRVMARLRVIRPSSVVPTDPLIAALAAARGKSTGDLIALFAAAAAL